jgi:hypothetical protein
MGIILSLREREILLQIVEDSLADLRTEIHETDNRDYKLQLKLKEETIRGIIPKLERAVVLAEV